MADISSLNLNPSAPIDWDAYKDSGEYRRPPVEGKYFLQAPSQLKAVAGSTGEKGFIVLTANKEGVLTAVIDGCTIANSQVEGANGYGVSRKWVDTAKNKFREGTSMGDYLRAHGINAGPLMTGKDGLAQNKVYADLIESTLGRLFQAVTSVEYRCSDCDEKKAQKVGYAKDAKGELLPIIKCAHCQKDIFARMVIKSFISAVASGAAATQAKQEAFA